MLQPPRPGAAWAAEREEQRHAVKRASIQVATRAGSPPAWLLVWVDLALSVGLCSGTAFGRFHLEKAIAIGSLASSRPFSSLYLPFSDFLPA
jgi:hypothetical protein